MRPWGKVKLRDQRAITREEYATALSVFVRIRNLIERRTLEVEQRGNASIGLPRKNWDPEGNPSEFFKFMAHVLSTPPTYDVINRLRFFAGGFSGISLLRDEWTFANYQERYVSYTTGDYDAMMERTSVFEKTLFSAVRLARLVRYLPTRLVVRPPRILGEIGWDVGGTIVNFDTHACQERIALLYEAGVIDWLDQKVSARGGANVLEIGAGYGALAYALKRVFPTVRYFIVDLPESLFFSCTYLALASPDVRYEIYDGRDGAMFSQNNHGYNFVPNYMFDNLVRAGIPIDLAINTLSFTEMSPEQVRHYAVALKAMLGREGVLFEQNPNIEREYERGCDAQKVISEVLVGERIVPRLVTPLRGITHLWANDEVGRVLPPALRPFHNRRALRRGWIMLTRWVETLADRARRSAMVAPARRLKSAFRASRGRRSPSPEAGGARR